MILNWVDTFLHACNLLTSTCHLLKMWGIVRVCHIGGSFQCHTLHTFSAFLPFENLILVNWVFIRKYVNNRHFGEYVFALLLQFYTHGRLCVWLDLSCINVDEISPGSCFSFLPLPPQAALLTVGVLTKNVTSGGISAWPRRQQAPTMSATIQDI